jgi:hypothetical protein
MPFVDLISQRQHPTHHDEAQLRIYPHRSFNDYGRRSEALAPFPVSQISTYMQFRMHSKDGSLELE